IHRAAQHPRELDLADPPLEGVDLLLGLGEGGVVALLDRELEEHLGVFDLAADGLDERELALDARALAQKALRLLLVVPETGLQGELIQLFEVAFQLGDVKETPLAPQSAV